MPSFFTFFDATANIFLCKEASSSTSAIVLLFLISGFFLTRPRPEQGASTKTKSAPISSLSSKASLT